MIYGKLANWELEKCCFPSPFASALEFLQDRDLTELPLGRHNIDGDQIFALVQNIVTGPAHLQRFELHRRYIDIHFIISGKEQQLYAPRQSQSTGLLEDDLDQKDIAFYSNPERYNRVLLYPGDYVVYLAGELHCPCCAIDQPESVKKIIFKIDKQCVANA